MLYIIYMSILVENLLMVLHLRKVLGVLADHIVFDELDTLYTDVSPIF